MGIHNGTVNLARFLMGKNDAHREKKQAPIEGVTAFLDIDYFGDKLKAHLLDIYYPENTATKLPVIIDIHGGGWIYGSKEINKRYCMDLCKRGFVVVNINYRLITEADGGTFPNVLADIVTALNWTKNNIGDHYGDTENFFLTGDSAGAHLAGVATATTVDEEFAKLLTVKPEINFNAIALTCGVSNVDNYVKSKAPIVKYLCRRLMGDDYANAPHTKYFSLKNCLVEKFPPIFFNTSYGDFMQKEVLECYNDCKNRGVECELYTYDVKQKNKLSHVYSVLWPEYPESVAVNDSMTAFFRRFERK